MGDKISEEEWENLQHVLDRLDAAYYGKTTGTWFQRWIPGVCKHDFTRCTHGDEIIHRGFKRQVCLSCGKSLNRPLPRICFFTGKPHHDCVED